MDDFEIKPNRLVIDIISCQYKLVIDLISCQCEDDQSGCTFFNKAYLLGYRPFNNCKEVDWYNNILMYKIVKSIKKSWISSILSMMSNWSSNTDKFVKVE